MPYAEIGAISVHLPERVETIEDLRGEFPNWDVDAIFEKTGINKRHIAAPEECASDLAVKAAEKLFREHEIDPQTIDFILFCTQTPDYPLPTTACLIQERLGLSPRVGALDFNLGCSGFVYGAALADGLIRTGSVKRILFLTAETYSKYIDPHDRSLRTIFGDAGAATIIDASDSPSLQAFRYGTNGVGANTLLLTRSGVRTGADRLSPRGRHRWKSDLYMDGPSLISFTVAEVPPVVASILDEAKLSKDQIELFILHQATRKLLELLRSALHVDDRKMPIQLENYGNTVSCTLPILISDLRAQGLIKPHAPNIMIGFGVGWSWAGCIWRDSFLERNG